MPRVQVLLPLPKNTCHFCGGCFFVRNKKGLEPVRVCALRKQFCKLFLAQSARGVLKFKEFRSPSGKKLLCNFGQVLEAPAKKKDIAFAVSFFFVCSKTCASRHAERAGHRRRSAAGGGYSEAVMAQRSKLLAAPRQKQFWAPQEGLRSKFKSLKPRQKKNRKCRCVLCYEQKTPINFV